MATLLAGQGKADILYESNSLTPATSARPSRQNSLKARPIRLVSFPRKLWLPLSAGTRRCSSRVKKKSASCSICQPSQTCSRQPFASTPNVPEMSLSCRWCRRQLRSSRFRSSESPSTGGRLRHGSWACGRRIKAGKEEVRKVMADTCVRRAMRLPKMNFSGQLTHECR